MLTETALKKYNKAKEALDEDYKKDIVTARSRCDKAQQVAWVKYTKAQSIAYRKVNSAIQSALLKHNVALLRLFTIIVKDPKNIDKKWK
jgi:hypothetical protein